MEVEGFSTVFLFAHDLERSVQFYTTLFSEGPSRVREGLLAQFQIGPTRLLVHSDAHATWLPAGAKKGVGIALHFKVASADKQWERLNKLGFPLPEKPESLHNGTRKFATKDPDGYDIELVEVLPGSPTHS